MIKTKTYIQLILIALIICILMVSVVAEDVVDAIFGEPSQFSLTDSGVSSEKSRMIDRGDYYFTDKGKKVSFFRKQGEYLLVRGKKKVLPTTFNKNVTQLFGSNVEVLRNHSFNQETVIKLNTLDDVNNTLSTIKSMDASIEYVSPVLRNPQQLGDVGLMPRILVKLTRAVSPQKLLFEQSIGASLTLNSKLKDSHQEYEYIINNRLFDPSEVFRLSRNVMNLSYVIWAEPVMVVTPQSSFTPDDTLFDNQWHLHNTSQFVGVIDADIDAPEGWELSKGDGAVIAIYDDGVQTNHPDLAIWTNSGETGDGKESNGIDDDENGYIDDYQGWDFELANNDPSPSTNIDNHGTAVAGVAGAQGNNSQGVTGSALNAVILPVRSGFMSCTDYANGMRYAGKYSDVVNNSFSISACETSLDSAIADVVNGNILNSKRGRKGTPVVFSSGNSASGWRKFSLSSFPAGSYDFRWEFIKNASISEGYDTVWLDEISWPGGSNTDFESESLGVIPSGFSSSGDSDWITVSDGTHARDAAGVSIKSGAISDSQVTRLDITKTVGTGDLYYWVWVSSELDNDFFNFYVDDVLYHHYSPGQNSGHTNAVAYPASNSDTIAVGGSQDGGPGGLEERSSYSQFGSNLDLVAPTSGGFQGIHTTDRTGSDGYSNSDYTTGFSGTSSSAPLVAGIIADMLALKTNLSATQVRQVLRLGTDQIGPYDYLKRRNDYYGYGRVNLLSALLKANQLNPDNMIKRNEIAERVLKYVHGEDYMPSQVATGSIFTDVSPGDFQADWIEELKLQGFSEGCSANKYCPNMFLTNEQAAKILLKMAHHDEANYTPPASAMVFADVPISNLNSDWIAQLKNEGFTEGCSDEGPKFCPNMLMSWEGLDEMFFNISK